ncbi:hypothetical protein F2Q68_00042757 [Brassica cretica]|uniref:Protein transport protein SEC23 n=2 Tax=Brassica cretica TaxID=69181 RepID=A0ABQ7ACQ9_BRACR|nr:hypothetical protein F2Q68_00042757 [Brassica cretica]KAF3495361.1 hypothetical protein DY000_02058198 [Brassica cretica]
MSVPISSLRTCCAALNSFARVGFTAKIWICPLCFQRNHFPPHYHAVSETNLPCELYWSGCLELVSLGLVLESLL